MKIRFPETDKIRTILKVRSGDVFLDAGAYYIRLDPPTIHMKDDGSVWAVRLDDGILTKYGPDKLVQVTDTELYVKL
jgi:hypothetical protein